MYKFVDIENLEEIRIEILKYFPKENFKLNKLFYIENNLEIFSKVSSLQRSLDSLCLKDFIVGYAFNINQPKSTYVIHTDTGNFDFSLNIPLVNCDNTKTIFYKTEYDPVLKETSDNRNVKYNYFDPNHCQEIDSFYFNRPCIIPVKVPHCVINNQLSTRISFLIRLGNGFSL